MDALDQDDAAGRRAHPGLSHLPRFGPARLARRPDRGPVPAQPADRRVDALHLFQGDPGRDPRGGAHGRRLAVEGARLCARPHGGAGHCLDPPPQHHPGLERGLLDAQSHHLGRCPAHRLHRLLFEPGRPVLGQAFGRIDHGDRADPRAWAGSPRSNLSAASHSEL